MCGIAGIFNLLTSKNIDKSHLAKMNQDLGNRGPDQSGTIVKENFGFTHRRLSILGVNDKAGEQPLYEDGVCLTYNGEIYNFQKVNKVLAKKGIKTASHCDTETLNYFLKIYNISKLDMLDGMFAFAYTNGFRIDLVRDVSGKKPLFYTIIDNQLYFSSSLRSLADIRNASIDKTAFIFNLLYGSTSFNTRTIFKNIFTVEPGSRVTFFYNRIQPVKERFLSFKPERKYYNFSFPDAVNHLQELLEESVKKRLMSDVPLGTYLSGGLDSTIITRIAKRYKEDLKTYSVCYNDQETRENTYAVFCSKHFGTDHTAVYPDFKDYLHIWKELIYQKRAPLSTSNEVLIYVLAKEAAKKLKVVLSGEGADELLAGYGAFSRSPMDFQRFILKKELKNPLLFEESLNRAYGKREFHTLREHFQMFYRRFNEHELLQILSPEFNIAEIITEIDSYFKALMNEVADLDLYTVYNYILYKINMRSLLDRLDFNTMNASLEARAPFLDKKVVDFCLNIPFSYKLRMTNQPECLCGFNAIEISNRFDTTKYILREAYKNSIPREIITRPKQSFPIPHELLYDVLGRKRLETKIEFTMHPFINNTLIKQWYETYNSEKFGFKLWTMENLLSYLDCYKNTN